MLCCFEFGVRLRIAPNLSIVMDHNANCGETVRAQLTEPGFSLKLHPIHGGSWQRRPISALSHAVLDGIAESVSGDLDQSEGKMPARINGLNVEISLDEDNAVECLPLALSEVSRGTAARTLILKVPSGQTLAREATQRQPVDVVCSSDNYTCRACLCRNFRGFRCCPTPDPSEDSASVRRQRLAQQHWICPKCAGQGVADSWLLIVEPLGKDLTREAVMQKALTSMSEAGAMRSDLDSALNVSDQELAVGSQAAVHRACAKHESHGEEYVVKFFDPVTAKGAAVGIETIKQEVVTLASVQPHPNIARMRGFFRASDPICVKGSAAWPHMAQYALLTDFYSGGDLSTVLKQRSFSEAEGAEIIVGVLFALSHLHAQKIVHRDVKVENILRSCDGRPVLTDFGLACLTSDVNEMSRRCGSPGYCAPEVVLGKPYDETVDIFALGSVLYSLLHRKTPFDVDGGDEIAVFRKTLKCQVRFDQPVSDMCKKFVRRLMSASASDRPSADKALTASFLIDAALARAPGKEPQSADRTSRSTAEPSHVFSRSTAEPSHDASFASHESGYTSPSARVAPAPQQESHKDIVQAQSSSDLTSGLHILIAPPKAEAPSANKSPRFARRFLRASTSQVAPSAPADKTSALKGLITQLGIEAPTEQNVEDDSVHERATEPDPIILPSGTSAGLSSTRGYGGSTPGMLHAQTVGHAGYDTYPDASVPEKHSQDLQSKIIAPPERCANSGVGKRPFVRRMDVFRRPSGGKVAQ